MVKSIYIFLWGILLKLLLLLIFSIAFILIIYLFIFFLRKRFQVSSVTARVHKKLLAVERRFSYSSRGHWKKDRLYIMLPQRPLKGHCLCTDTGSPSQSSCNAATFGSDVSTLSILSYSRRRFFFLSETYF